MYGLESDEPRIFMHRGYKLFCKPLKFRKLREKLDCWEKRLSLRIIEPVNPVNNVGIFINWESVVSILKEDTSIWSLLLALGVLSFEKNGNVEIFPSSGTPIGIRHSDGSSHIFFFTSELHARMCLVTVFANWRDRHLYKYDKDGNVVLHEELF